MNSIYVSLLGLAFSAAFTSIAGFSSNGTGQRIMNVVFACKSNSCRSQMAEGWAKEWVKRQLESFPDDSERSSILDEVLITSVALDSSAVFHKRESSCSDVSSCSDTSAPQHKAVPSCLDTSVGQRKSVKAKAVEAMKLDGIDISNSTPKTFAEILPLVKRTTSADPNVAATFITTDGLEDDDEQKEVDRLVILCSCGNEVKQRLVSRSKAVEEWDIDAPTAAARSGEGDGAYRRLSLQIRDQVNRLMENLLDMDTEPDLALSRV